MDGKRKSNPEIWTGSNRYRVPALEISPLVPCNPVPVVVCVSVCVLAPLVCVTESTSYFASLVNKPELKVVPPGLWTAC